MRAAIHYGLAAILLTYYGIEVCPFLESLPVWKLATILSASFVLAFVGRTVLTARWVLRRSDVYQPARQFKTDFAMFVLAGAFLTTFNAMVYEFPVHSGLKVSMGALTLGLFAALDLALQRQRIMAAGAAHDAQLREFTGSFRSLSDRFAVIAFVIAALFVIDTLLVVAKDVLWIVDVGQAGRDTALKSIAFEIVFVVAVLFGHVLNLIFSYAGNLKLFFDTQMAVLDGVAAGDLSDSVPVMSHDEFGLIASHTNSMIAGLREKQRVKAAFGKFVNPVVMQKLLAQGDEALKLGGARRDLVVLFSDIRGFSTRSEAMNPETVVRDLNLYLTTMVALIHAEGGVVDKFIGDGILAVFGLDGVPDAASRAVRAATAMQNAVAGMAGQFSSPISIGIGIHRGHVIAGNIGSPDRLEFTVIGDTVNTASRLESATKDARAGILISADVYLALAANLHNLPWLDFGALALKGKAERIHCYGLPAPAGAITAAEKAVLAVPPQPAVPTPPAKNSARAG